MAVNLAYMLKSNGASVGLVDVDVYGPSLNTLLPLENKQIYFTPASEASGSAKEVLRAGEGSLIPLDYDGIKLMSYSYFRPEAEAFAAVRGPLASSLAYQMVTQTAWGQIDYLLIDMPPGTGDIHLTLGQAVKITGAVVVTTPQQLRYEMSPRMAQITKLFAHLKSFSRSWPKAGQDINSPHLQLVGCWERYSFLPEDEYTHCCSD